MNRHARGFRLEPRGLQKFLREIHARQRVTSPGQFDGMAAVAARNVEQARGTIQVRSRRQCTLQKIGFRQSNGRRNGASPELDRRALKKRLKPFGFQWESPVNQSDADAHVDTHVYRPGKGPRQESGYRTAKSTKRQYSSFTT